MKRTNPGAPRFSRAQTSIRYAGVYLLALLLAMTAAAVPSFGEPFTVAVVRDGPSADDKVVGLVKQELRELAEPLPREPP